MTDKLDGSPLISQVLGDATEKLTLFHKKLEEEGELRGLIGPRDVDILWERHILNSAAIIPFIRKNLPQDFSKTNQTPTIGDIGSGGGFPGIIVATCLPEVTVYLVEPMERRVEWLNEVVSELELTNAVVIRARAEEIVPRKAQANQKTNQRVNQKAKNKNNKLTKQINNSIPSITNITQAPVDLLPHDFTGFDIVTCRAVAPMSKLAGMVMPLVMPGGCLVALKGKSAGAEILKAEKELRKNHVVSTHVYDANVAEGLEPTHVVVTIKHK